MSDKTFRYQIDTAIQTTLDTASSPQVGVYYWEDEFNTKYTSEGHLEYINSLGIYSVDVSSTMASLKELSENQNILDIQESDFLNSIAQIKFVEISQDVSTTAGEQINETVTLLESIITPNEVGNKLEIMFTVSAIVDTSSDRVMVFHLFIDGIFKRATRIFSDRGNSERSGSGSLAYVYTIDSSDPVDVEIRWGHNGSGTAKIQVDTEPEYSHSSLIIKEVRA